MWVLNSCFKKASQSNEINVINVIFLFVIFNHYYYYLIFLWGNRQVFLNDHKHLQFPADFSTPPCRLNIGCMYLFTRVYFPSYNAPYCMQRVPGTRHVWHSSRLFCFGRLPAPVLHLFAGPVWCGVNNIQTYTHALISIHSGRQCRTPSLLRGWHFGKGQIHLAKNLCLYPAHHVPRLSVVLPENSLCLSSQNIFFVRADRRGFINLCHITAGNTCGLEWHRNTGQKNASCVKHHVVMVVSGRLFKLGGCGGGVEGASTVEQFTRWPSEVWHAAPSPSKAWIHQP